MIEIDVSMSYRLGPERTALLALEAAAAPGQEIVEHRFEIANADLHHLAGENRIGRRCWAVLPDREMNLRYVAQVEVTRPRVSLDDLADSALQDIPGEFYSYLRPSRYCESDLFEDFARTQFGHLTGGGKVAAIRDWVRSEITYEAGHSDATTTMAETFDARRGVCRDFVHVFCGLVRASHIPARYVAAYGPDVTPPDFHAVAEVWLNDRWFLVDPTGMCAADEIVVIGAGRDAADVPFMETPDDAELIQLSVQVTRR
ncbi:transglutaminase family protein [Ponticoccus sp. SC2-23]|uniref:transglutaminase-like domain-containing protein n=1 Tax=Alexandriicola marinus TaxID=2081710 RepID=UPI000FDB6A38|nr:transglutaminase family protein [Alexandriicola marinus]MBM1221319.1 transglutaminase family protein [Ponticoccus sp. SC6-9]MBM1225889.1 transglutaminase family protein [Ponticoccus sp. SC6-15]MBM1228041.1 transglutaminase family protein [Ponticoccus sp. SC6-38]MBM1234321.1 transglutaminase family protein [Ponticoccus sp. SC6-45]MBM1238543.1 transglutaminase family protein [Ponticoccus sp. SC6-49]MBM1243812.1 transglutaminase family protein [Ponticoccus sp. SC2-64]MBM1247845.1 transglutam